MRETKFLSLQSGGVLQVGNEGTAGSVIAVQ